MSVAEDDPLRNADIGETKTVRESVELHTINFSPDTFYKSDRIGRCEAVDVQIAEDEDGSETVVVTFEGELTKILPRNWDKSSEPRTAAEEKQSRRAVWKRRAATAAMFLVPVGIATYLTSTVMEQIAGQSIHTEPIQPPGIEVYFVMILMIAFLAWSIPRLPEWREKPGGE